MKRITVNKGFKVLFNYKGIDYLVENYQTMGCYGQKIEAYDLYDTKTKEFLFFQWYPKLWSSKYPNSLHCPETDDYYTNLNKGILKIEQTKLIIKEYLEHKRRIERAKLNEDNFLKGGVIED